MRSHSQSFDKGTVGLAGIAPITYRNEAALGYAPLALGRSPHGHDSSYFASATCVQAVFL